MEVDEKKKDFILNSLGLTSGKLNHIKHHRQMVTTVQLIDLINYDPNININWIFTGEGTMFIDHQSDGVAEDRVSYGDNMASRVARLERVIDFIKKEL